MSDSFPRPIPNVYATSDGKLHSSEVAAIAHQEKLNFEVPWKRAIATYDDTRRRYYFGGSYYTDSSLLLNCLKEQGLKIVKE